MGHFFLHLETATTNCSVALSHDDKLVALKEANAPKFRHSDHLHLFIDNVLQHAGISYAQLSAVAVSMGPGSYTGLRIGVSTAKGLCYANELPLIAVNTLEVLARNIQPKAGQILIPMLDARRMEVFTMHLDAQYHVIEPTTVKIITQETGAEFPKGQKLLFGSGAEKCQTFLNDASFSYPEVSPVPSAKNMISLVNEKFKNKVFEDVAYFEPFYLKDFYTTAPKAK